MSFNKLKEPTDPNSAYYMERLILFALEFGLTRGVNLPADSSVMKMDKLRHIVHQLGVPPNEQDEEFAGTPLKTFKLWTSLRPHLKRMLLVMLGQDLAEAESHDPDLACGEETGDDADGDQVIQKVRSLGGEPLQQVVLMVRGDASIPGRVASFLEKNPTTKNAQLAANKDPEKDFVSPDADKLVAIIKRTHKSFVASSASAYRALAVADSGESDIMERWADGNAAHPMEDIIGIIARVLWQ